MSCFACDQEPCTCIGRCFGDALEIVQKVFQDNIPAMYELIKTALHNCQRPGLFSIPDNVEQWVCQGYKLYEKNGEVMIHIFFYHDEHERGNTEKSADMSGIYTMMHRTFGDDFRNALSIAVNNVGVYTIDLYTTDGGQQQIRVVATKGDIERLGNVALQWLADR